MKTETNDLHNGVLIFVHIPKAAGTTLHHIIEHQYPRSAMYRCDLQDPEAAQRFLALTEEEKGRIQCLRGHVPYGMHDYLPRQPVYVTMLRSPLERFISKYNHVRRVPEYTSRIGMPQSRTKTIEDFIDLQIEREAMNFQTRMIGGFLDLMQPTPPFDPLPKDALKIAKNNLESKFLLAGLAHRFDEFLALMKQLAGWKKLYYARLNVSYNTNNSQLDSKSQERILELNKLDLELVEYAECLFDEQIRKQGDALIRDVKKIQTVSNFASSILNGIQYVYQTSGARSLRIKLRRAGKTS